MIFVSPAEPKRIRDLLIAGDVDAETSTSPERWGADFLWLGANRDERKWFGVQRKTVKDFLASIVQDDRITREIGQMKSLHLAVFVIEGAAKFTDDGFLMGQWKGSQRITEQSWRGMIWSLNINGIHVHYTRSEVDTVRFVEDLYAWSQKERHNALLNRGAPVNMWGKPSNEDYAKFLLQGLPGVGPELADAIFKTFGRVPFAWDVTVDDLTQVPGIGKKKAETIYEGIRSK